MSFSKLIGNEVAKATLSRLIEQNTLPPTLLFCGPEGVGKGAFALQTAQALMGPAASAKLASGNHPDLHLFRPEGKAGVHPIENIRQLIDQAALPAFEAKAKVFLLYDAHQMLATSSNALLKLLEEPPPSTYFILMTSQVDALLPTIVSRARKIVFFPIPGEEIKRYVQAQWNKDEKEAERIAFLSHGSLARALHALNAAEESMQGLVEELMLLSLPEDYARLLSLCEQIEKKLSSANEENLFLQSDLFLEQIFAWYRDMILIKEGISFEFLYYADALLSLKQCADKMLFSLESILDKMLTMRSALQRHVKLRTLLEHFYIGLEVK